jgi:hypothetical protein
MLAPSEAENHPSCACIFQPEVVPMVKASTVTFKILKTANSPMPHFFQLLAATCSFCSLTGIAIFIAFTGHSKAQKPHPMQDISALSVSDSIKTIGYKF